MIKGARKPASKSRKTAALNKGKATRAATAKRANASKTNTRGAANKVLGEYTIRETNRVRSVDDARRRRNGSVTPPKSADSKIVKERPTLPKGVQPMPKKYFTRDSVVKVSGKTKRKSTRKRSA